MAARRLYRPYNEADLRAEVLRERPAARPAPGTTRDQVEAEEYAKARAFADELLRQDICAPDVTYEQLEDRLEEYAQRPRASSAAGRRTGRGAAPSPRLARG